MHSLTSDRILPKAARLEGLLFHWPLAVYFPLSARHTVPGCQEGLCVAWRVNSGVLSTCLRCLLFCYTRTPLLLLTAACLVYGEWPVVAMQDRGPGGFLKDWQMCKKSPSGDHMYAANPLGKDPLGRDSRKEPTSVGLSISSNAGPSREACVRTGSWTETEGQMRYGAP